MDKGFRDFETSRQRSRQRSRQPPVDMQGLEAGGRREVEGTSLRLTSRVEAPFCKGISEENGRLGGLFLLRNAIKGELQPLFRMY